MGLLAQSHTPVSAIGSGFPAYGFPRLGFRRVVSQAWVFGVRFHTPDVVVPDITKLKGRPPRKSNNDHPSTVNCALDHSVVLQCSLGVVLHSLGGASGSTSTRTAAV